MGPVNNKYDDDIVKPFTPLPGYPIRIIDFLGYVADHQRAIEKYKDEYQVRR